MLILARRLPQCLGHATHHHAIAGLAATGAVLFDLLYLGDGILRPAIPCRAHQKLNPNTICFARGRERVQERPRCITLGFLVGKDRVGKILLEHKLAANHPG